MVSETRAWPILSLMCPSALIGFDHPNRIWSPHNTQIQKSSSKLEVFVKNFKEEFLDVTYITISWSSHVNRTVIIRKGNAPDSTGTPVVFDRYQFLTKEVCHVSKGTGKIVIILHVLSMSILLANLRDQRLHVVTLHKALVVQMRLFFWIFRFGYEDSYQTLTVSHFWEWNMIIFHKHYNSFL